MNRMTFQMNFTMRELWIRLTDIGLAIWMNSFQRRIFDSNIILTIIVIMKFLPVAVDRGSFACSRERSQRSTARTVGRRVATPRSGQRSALRGGSSSRRSRSGRTEKSLVIWGLFDLNLNQYDNNVEIDRTDKIMEKFSFLSWISCLVPWA